MSEKPKMKPMLAASEIPAIETLNFPLMASIKLDGVRCPMADGVGYSRKLLPLPNKYFQEWCSEYGHLLHGIDCEVVVGEPWGEHVFNRTSSGIMSLAGEPKFNLHVFDVWASPFDAETRQRQLEDWKASLPYAVERKVEVLIQHQIASAEELLTLAAYAQKAEYEGLILKHPKRPYKFGRSTLKEQILLKWKSFADDEGVVLEVLQGQINMNPVEKDELGHAKRSTAKAGMVPSNLCGGFLVESEKFGKVRVSTGNLKEPELKEILENRHKYIGETLVYKYQPYGMKNKPRFPGFKGWRHQDDMGEPDDF